MINKFLIVNKLLFNFLSLSFFGFSDELLFIILLLKIFNILYNFLAKKAKKLKLKKLDI